MQGAAVQGGGETVRGTPVSSLHQHQRGGDVWDVQGRPRPQPCRGWSEARPAGVPCGHGHQGPWGLTPARDCRVTAPAARGQAATTCPTCPGSTGELPPWHTVRFRLTPGRPEPSREPWWTPTAQSPEGGPVTQEPPPRRPRAPCHTPRILVTPGARPELLLFVCEATTIAQTRAPPGAPRPRSCQ